MPWNMWYNKIVDLLTIFSPFCNRNFRPES